MISEVRIKNFQSHKDSVIKFDPGVNIITGRSDSGKTAILRAIRWVVWNRPTGDEFRSHWGGDTQVDLVLDSGDIVSRIKKGTKNLYKLNDTTFSAFGVGVPEEIQKALNLSEINLQQQLDSPFLLTKSSGEVAAHFNKVANLHIIEKANSFLKSNTNKLKSTFSLKKEEIKDQKKKLEQYESLEKWEAELEVLEEMDRKLSQKRANVQRFEEVISQITKVESKIKSYDYILSKEEKIKELEEKNEQLLQVIEDYRELNEVITNMTEVEEDINSYSDLFDYEEELLSLIEKKKKVEELTVDFSALSEIVESYRETEEELKEAEETAQRLEEEFHKNFPDECPLCGSKIKKEEIK